MKKFILAAIRFYQRHISPARPPCCRLSPPALNTRWRPLKNTAPFGAAGLLSGVSAAAIPFTGASGSFMTPSPKPYN